MHCTVFRKKRNNYRPLHDVSCIMGSQNKMAGNSKVCWKLEVGCDTQNLDCIKVVKIELYVFFFFYKI